MEGCWLRRQCPVSRAERHRSGRFILIKDMLKSVGALVLVHLREVVHFSEGPLREVPLYMCISFFSCSSHTSCSQGRHWCSIIGDFFTQEHLIHSMVD